VIGKRVDNFIQAIAECVGHRRFLIKREECAL